MKKRLVILVGLLIAVALIAIAATALSTAQPKPSEGWTLHIDAKRHFPGNPDMIAHHYCKPGVDGLVAQCQLYASDDPNASLVGVEVVVSAETFNTFSDAEKALWHFHKTEIPNVEATLPDLPPEEAALVLKSLEETYGKVYLLWDPSISNLPIGNPMISIVDHGGSRVIFQALNLDPLEKGHYEGWVISKGKKISFGNFNVNKQKQLIDLSGKVIKEFRTKEDVDVADAFAITIEPDNDINLEPSSSIILFGQAKNNFANMAFEAIDFNKLSGRFILATPTNDPEKNETAGVWFLDPTNAPVLAPSLNLPNAPAGWKYEGWAVHAGIHPLTTGKFTKVVGPDEFNDFSGPAPAPPFPGEDFIKNLPFGLQGPLALDDGKSLVVISIEPDLNGVDPTGDGPFQLQPLVGKIPAGAKDHFMYDLELKKDTLPMGFAVLMGKDLKKQLLRQSTSDVRRFSDGSVVPGASSRLLRTNEGVTMELHTSELNASEAATIWWVIFNKPENCTQGEFSLRCGAGDLSNPETQPSVMFAAGSVTNAKGNAIFGGHLSVGDTKGCPPGFPCSGGLTNSMGADIHLVVRDHGPIIPELLHEQISTFGGGCSDAPPGTGKPGPNICKDVQFSAHEATLDP